MSGHWVVIGTLAGVVLGASLEYGFQFLTHRRNRREAVADRLRSERREAYIALIEATRRCAHELARAALHDYGPPADAEARSNAAYLFDLEFVPRFSVVGIIGTREAVDAAAEMYDKLDRFRDCMTTGDQRVRYRSEEYNEIYDPFREARNEFTDLVRAELTETGLATG